MKDKPVLLNGQMVRAILEGRQTQFRRVVKPQPDPRKNIAHIGPELLDKKGIFQTWLRNSDGGIDQDFNAQFWVCPYGPIGRRLWVRETWKRHKEPNLPDGIMYRADGLLRYYTGDEPEQAHDYERTDKWRPSIHMPRWASRLTLEVTDIRVERLQEITEEDARAEGVDPYVWGHGTVSRDEYHAEGGYHNGYGYRNGFDVLWDSINGKSYPWESNPWVWVVSFRDAQD